MVSRIPVLTLLAILAVPGSFLVAASKAQIDQAVERGVRQLMSSQAADGSWDYAGYPEGATALAAFALLESGVQTKDPAIQRAAQYVRSRSTCQQTYSISLMIFFLDRLGDPQDKALLVTLGERLRNGQSSNGAWSYACSDRPVAAGGFFGGDNSNTQFAILGLWVARRHNVEVKAALERADKYFRSSQGRDGGWNYVAMAGMPGAQAVGVPMMGTSTGAMTCAGLLGLLVQIGNQAALRAGDAKDLKVKPQAAGNAPRPVDPLKDPAVQAGMKCLEQFLTPQGNAGARFGLGTELYFLWSVERVGMAYGVKKIGAVDWYAAGADRIVASQQANGSWSDYSPNVGTSLALLFLKRANVASDLTRLVGGETELRSGNDTEEFKNAANTPAAAKPGRPAAVTSADIASMSPEKLKAALPGLSPKQQAAALEELRDRKGAEATIALAESIGTLDETTAAQARQFLVERLQRMTPATLARYLEYNQEAIQLAAAQAAQSKNDPSLANPLISLLEHKQARVADAAHAALVKITGQQFGLFAGKSTVERFVVVKKWKAWRDGQRSSRNE